MIQRTIVSLLFCFWCCALSMAAVPRIDPLQRTIRTAQRKVVKIYGAGGFRQMEAYQSGILISGDGQILTALSYVLDTDDLVAVLDDGRRLKLEIVGSDPVSELALLKPVEEEVALPHFRLDQATTATEGQRVLALSNLYGIATGNESASVQQGVVMAVAPLDARRGAQRSQYRNSVYVLDAPTNNPGAAGGALVDWNGRLIGVLGKELRSRVTGTWLNYALPAENVAQVVADIQSGKLTGNTAENQLVAEKPLSTELLGFMVVPDVLQRTPPYVDTVEFDSAAAEAGLRSDDLVVFLDDRPIASCRELRQALSFYEADQEVTISVLRAGELLVLPLQVPPQNSSTEQEPAETLAP